MTNLHAREDELEALMNLRVKKWIALPPGERLLQAMAILADVVKVREKKSNRGPWVEAFLASCGLGPGYAWCAASLKFCARVVHAPSPSERPASVAGWREWGKETGRWAKSLDDLKRGDLVTADYGGGKGHIGIVVKVVGPMVWSIEGNTGPEDSTGSQREGDGLYRRVRLKKFWNGGFIQL